MSKETAKYFDGPTMWEKIQADGEKWAKEYKEKNERILAERAERDRKIQRLLDKGLRPRQIADQLGWKLGTVNNAIKRSKLKQRV